MLIKKYSKELDLNGVIYKLRVTMHRNDSGFRTLQVTLRPKFDEKNRFYYFNNNNGIRFFEHHSYKNTGIQRKAISYRDGKIQVLKILTNS